MRILITGATGQLGTALRPVLARHDLILKDLPSFDLTGPNCEAEIVEAAPNVIIHAAAYTNVDGAEKDPDRARAVNVQGTATVARAAQRLGARLLYVSTDYVFDGTKTLPYEELDEPRPLNVYGQTKYEGELAVLRHCGDSLVVRTAWLYGHGGPNFVKTIMRVATQQPFLEVVMDQRGCPTNADELAMALTKLMASDLRGICHVTNRGDCTWHEFAEAIVRCMGLAIEVRPITTLQAGRLARRPAYSVLARHRFETAEKPLPHWNESLSRFVAAQLKANAVGMSSVVHG